MPELASTIRRAAGTFARLQESCIECGGCTQRCDLLQSGDWNLGRLCRESVEALSGADSLEGLRRAIDASGELYRFVRSCEECNRCTVHCPQDLSMSEMWQPWRELVRLSGHIGDDEVGLIKVDCTWHTFSAYRAVQGIGYDDLPQVRIAPIDGAPAKEAEPARGTTLFFPGCTLCSYAPELTRAAFAWLDAHAGPCLISEQCCAWPLECVGEMERAVAWRERLVRAAAGQGATRVVTVCPGCERQLAAAAAVVAPHIEFVSFARLLVEAGVRVENCALEGLDLPLTVVDSCNDRAGGHGPYVRQLFERVDCRAFPCTGEDAWCCGAGGNVASYDEELPRKRTRRSFGLCEQAGAKTLVTACPTCAYTYAFERWRSGGATPGKQAPKPLAASFIPGSVNYLEIVFGKRIAWPDVFGGLGDMWQGEHGAWVDEQLSSSM